MIEIPSVVQGKNGWQWTEDYAIGLNEKLGLINFWVAGFTQNRQHSHKLIWEAFEAQQAVGLIVSLIPEPENQYDSHAIGVWIGEVPGSISQIGLPTKLGYVPKRISKTLSLSLGQVASSFITETRENVYGKYYNCKVTLQVRKQFQTKSSSPESRFSHLLEALEEEIAFSTPTL